MAADYVVQINLIEALVEINLADKFKVTIEEDAAIERVLPNTATIDRLVVNEIPSGLVDGNNRVFTLDFDFIQNTTMLYLNGQRLLKNGNDYSEIVTKTIQFTTPDAPQPGDTIIIDYVKI